MLAVGVTVSACTQTPTQERISRADALAIASSIRTARIVDRSAAKLTDWQTLRAVAPMNRTGSDTAHPVWLVAMAGAVDLHGPAWQPGSVVVLIDAVDGTIESTNTDTSAWPVYWPKLTDRSPLPLEPRVQDDIATRADLAQIQTLAASWRPLLPLTVPTGYTYQRVHCAQCRDGFSIALDGSSGEWIRISESRSQSSSSANKPDPIDVYRSVLTPVSLASGTWLEQPWDGTVILMLRTAERRITVDGTASREQLEALAASLL